MHVETIHVPEALTVRNATAFASEARERINRFPAVRLDFAQARELDLSAVQLVAAMRMHADAAGVALGLARPADGALLALLERAGFLADPAPADLDFWFHGERPQ